ncbi:MAG: glycosyltransferase family 2 protein [Gammaproteobacteria bacterium]|nr:glycosyltransferase family 2 protein [Gammaproteobacteria bacterium]MDH3465658.1 glycosyltransferase family 2 protein [Gammaproteobacteria bacterium]
MPIATYFKTAGKFERAGQLDKALYTLLRANSDDSQKAMRHIHEINFQRLIAKAGQLAKSLISALHPIPLFEQIQNPNNCMGGIVEAIDCPPPIISLTSISGRIGRVEQTINSILEQTFKPHSINLYVSDKPYLIDQGIPANSDSLKRLAALGVNIYHVKNIGPYRKHIPLIVQLRSNSASPRTPIITMDDDVIYPLDIVERLMSALEKENAVVAHRGREIAFDGEMLADYRSFASPSLVYSYLNMGTGRNGIAYRLGYFPSNPEDFVGPILAPTADDVWCKWVTSIYCIPTLILEPSAAYDPSLDFNATEPTDKNGLFDKYNAKGTNDEALANLEKYFSSRGVGVVSLFRGFHHG